jgi:hypothetical protein
MNTKLTAHLAREIGGWDARYATVLAIATDGPVGISIIDPNGDGNITESQHFYRDDTGHWHAGSSTGGATPDMFGVHGSGCYSGVRYVYGRAANPGRHTVTYQGHEFDVTPEPTGWWAIAQAVDDEEGDVTLGAWDSP